MLKVLENKEEALERISVLAQEPELKDFQVGLGGSFAKNTNKKNSSIDIVLKAKETDKSKVGSVSILKFIKKYTSQRYANKFNIIWYDLLCEDEENLLEFVREMQLDPNPLSMFVNIVEEVQWVD